MMEIPKKNSFGPSTIEEYLKTPKDERWEIIEGVPFNMSPAPSPKHGQIVRELVTEFNVHLRGKECQVFTAPVDVFPYSDEKMDGAKKETVVQPDVFVVCDRNQISDRGCEGAPDLVIEVLSPSTMVRDKEEKLFLYMRSGVKEYWIVDPNNQAIDVYKFSKEPDRFPDIKSYKVNELGRDSIKVSLFDELEIELKTIFE